MSGHSKWANIKHKKGAADKKKAKIFSRVTKEIIVAVKTGGADASANARLRAALISARSANMPKDNIERAIKKAAGEADTSNYEDIVYEGYAPSGVAIIVETMSDNRNRTAGEVRMVFDRHGGNMASSGAVTWMFHRKSRFVVTVENASEEKLMDIVLDAGAEDIDVADGVAEIIGPPEAFEAISKALEAAKIPTEEAEIARIPSNKIEIKDVDTANKVIKLIEKMEELDDVQAVYSNFEITDDVMKALVNAGE